MYRRSEQAVNRARVAVREKGTRALSAWRLPSASLSLIPAFSPI